MLVSIVEAYEVLKLGGPADSVILVAREVRMSGIIEGEEQGMS